MKYVGWLSSTFSSVNNILTFISSTKVKTTHVYDINTTNIKPEQLHLNEYIDWSEGSWYKWSENHIPQPQKKLELLEARLRQIPVAQLLFNIIISLFIIKHAIRSYFAIIKLNYSDILVTHRATSCSLRMPWLHSIMSSITMACLLLNTRLPH